MGDQEGTVWKAVDSSMGQLTASGDLNKKHDNGK